VSLVEHLAEGVTLYCGDCREIVPTLAFDCVITDPPYSLQLHAAHDARHANGNDGTNRKALGYAGLSNADAVALAPLLAACPGWVVWMTDHSLAPVITQALSDLGRCIFPPLPYFHPGRSVRLSGDGPCSWTDWIIVARTTAQSKWGTLRGGYVAGEGWNDKARMGGKPTALMRALVADYSRHGDAVLDPFMGAGTTGVACVQEGRGFVGVEIDADAFDIACRRIAAEIARPRLPLEMPAAKPTQGAML